MLHRYNRFGHAWLLRSVPGEYWDAKLEADRNRVKLPPPPPQPWYRRLLLYCGGGDVAVVHKPEGTQREADTEARAERDAAADVVLDEMVVSFELDGGKEEEAAEAVPETAVAEKPAAKTPAQLEKEVRERLLVLQASADLNRLLAPVMQQCRYVSPLVQYVTQRAPLGTTGGAVKPMCFDVMARHWCRQTVEHLLVKQHQLEATAAALQRAEDERLALQRAAEEEENAKKAAAIEARRLKAGLMPWLQDGSSSSGDDEEEADGKKKKKKKTRNVMAGFMHLTGSDADAPEIRKGDDESRMAAQIKAAQKAAHVGRGHWVDGHWILEEFVEEKMGDRKLRERREKAAQAKKDAKAKAKEDALEAQDAKDAETASQASSWAKRAANKASSFLTGGMFSAGWGAGGAHRAGKSVAQL